ncbi:MAG: flagellar assembly protein FliH [Myxococcaceae bacterium]|nr:flagellar assembly protein FliH [Myxococcaceae bacterium]
MRAPSFMQGVTPRPSQPAKFMRLVESQPTAAPTPPAVAAPVAPAPTPAPLPTPPAPIGMSVALSELRPPPTPPPPAPAPQQSSAQVQHALEKLSLQNERLAELARTDALEIGFMVAERILEQEVSQNPRALISLVRSAMRKLADGREVKVSVSAADHERLSAANEPGLVNVTFVVDPTFGAGDIKVTSELGVVDARMSTRLAELKKAAEGED